MTLEWSIVDGQWSAHDTPPSLVHGAALIRAAQPGVCVFARDDRLHVQIGPQVYELAQQLPRIRWHRDRASFGLRRTFVVESSTGESLYTHSYWTGQGDEFFAWLAARAADPEWRAATAIRWSHGVQPAELRGG